MHAGHWANICQKLGRPLTSSWYSDLSPSFVKLSILFKLLVPPERLGSCNWGSFVGVLGIPLCCVLSHLPKLCCPTWWIVLRKWNPWMCTGTRAGAQRHLPDVIRHPILNMSWNHLWLRLKITSQFDRTADREEKSRWNGNWGSIPWTAICEMLSESV